MPLNGYRKGEGASADRQVFRIDRVIRMLCARGSIIRARASFKETGLPFRESKHLAGHQSCCPEKFQSERRRLEQLPVAWRATRRTVCSRLSSVDRSRLLIDCVSAVGARALARVLLFLARRG